MQLKSNNIENIIEVAFNVLKGKQNELRDLKTSLNSCQISLAEFERREKEINEWQFLIDNEVENPLSVVSQNVVYIDREHGLMFLMGNPCSFLSSLKEGVMVMCRTTGKFGGKYIPDDEYFIGPRCLSDTKFFNIPKFDVVRLAWGEAMEKPYQPDFRITRKVI